MATFTIEVSESEQYIIEVNTSTADQFSRTSSQDKFFLEIEQGTDGTAETTKNIIEITTAVDSESDASSLTIEKVNEINLVVSSDFVVSHPTISAASSVDNSGNYFIQDLFFDQYGHVTGLSSTAVTGSLSVSETDPIFTGSPAYGISDSDTGNWNTAYNWISINSGTIISSGDNISLLNNDVGYITGYVETGLNTFITGVYFNSGTKDLVLNRNDSVEITGKLDGVLVSGTSYHISVNGTGVDGSGRTYVQDILVDIYGHITGINTATETVVDTNTETLTSLTGDSVNTRLIYIDESGTTNYIPLDWAMDDTNLAYLVSGNVDSSGIATFTRSDDTSFTVDFSVLFDDTNLSRITSGNFDTSSGILTLTRELDDTSISVSFDGRYATTGELSSVSGYLQDQIDNLPPDTNTFVTGISYNSTTHELTLARNSGSVTGVLENIIHSGDNISLLVNDANYVDGSGTANYITKWSDNNTVADSIIYDDGTNIGIGTNTPQTELDVSGNLTALTGNLDVLSFNVDNESILTKGQISWDDTEGVLDVGLTDTVTMHVGQHRFYRIRNQTGSTLYKGQVVYATGVHSNGIITPSLYIADNSIDEVRFIGVMLEDVNNNNNGYVIDFGHVEQIDLDGSATNFATGTETWVAGDILYAHPTVAGKLTNVKPKHAMTVAIILDVGTGNGNGRMFVRPSSYGDIADSHDVSTSGLIDNQFLVYDSGTDYWKPSSGLYYADGNLGIGTATPSECPLHIEKNGDTCLLMRDTSGAGYAGLLIRDSGNHQAGSFQYGSPDAVLIANEVAAGSRQSGIPFVLYQGDYNSNGGFRPEDRRMSFTTDGNVYFYSGVSVGIGTATPSYTLDVVGSGRIVHADGDCGLIIQDTGGSGIHLGDCAFSLGSTYAGMKHSSQTDPSEYMIISRGDHTFLSAASGYDTIIRGGNNTVKSELRVKDVGDGEDAIIFNEQGYDRDVRMEGLGDEYVFHLDASTDRVGIGVQLPTAKLEIADEIIGSGTLLSLNGTSWGDGEKAYLSWNRGGSYVANIGAELTGGATNAHIVFETAANTERMRITSDGKVGIGTATPQAKLDVNGTVQFDNLVRWEYPDKVLDTSIATLGYMRLYDEVGGYCGLGVSASSFNVGTSGAINLRFLTSATERAKIDTAGNFIINENGYTTDFRVEGDADPYLLYVKGGGGADKVGIGTSTLNGKFNVYQTTTNQSYQYGIYNSANHYTTSSGTNYIVGNYTDVRKRVASGVTDNGYIMGHECIGLLADEGSLASAFGLRTYAGINNESDNGSLTAAYGIQSRVINYGQGTANINTAHGVNVYIQGDLGNVGNGEITNAYGLYVNPLYNVTTYAYGLYIAAMESATTNRYGIYQNGTNDTNVFMGDVGIGTNDPSSPLTVAASNEEGIRIHTASAPSQNFIIGRNTSNGTLVFKGSQSDFSAYEFRSTIGGSSQTILQTDRLSGAITFNDEYTFPTTDGSAGQSLVTDGSGSVSWQDQNVDISSVNGRLTLETATPISTTDQIAKTTLYFTPYNGNQVSVYNGTNWSVKTLSEISLSLSGYAADTNFDIFVYDNAGTLTLESAAWTDDTTRATALTTQDGVYVKSGATTRRYLGTIRTTGTTGQCEDSTSRRLVWNYYNQEIRIMSGVVSGSHTYALNTYRAYDGNTSIGGARVDCVIGLRSAVHFHVNTQNKHGYTGISYDTATNITTNAVVHDGTNTGTGMRTTASDIYYLVAGYHFLQVVENNVSGSTASFYWLQHRSYLRG